MEKYPQGVDSAVDKKLDFRGTNFLKSTPRKLIFVFGCFATHLGRTATAVETKQWGPCRAIGKSRSKGARQRLLASTIGLLVTRVGLRAEPVAMTSRAGLASPVRVACHAAATELTGSVLGGRHSGHAMWLRKGFSAQPIDRPSRESREASVLEAVRACSGGGFSGNCLCHRDDRSSDCRPWSNVAVSEVMGRCGNSRFDFGCGSHVSPQVRSTPKATVECPLSLQHAEGRGCAPKGELLRAPRASFLEVSPRASGKGRALARAATGDSVIDPRVDRLKPLGSGFSLLACHERASRVGPERVRRAIAPVTTSPGKGCHGPAECVTVRLVHAV